MGTEDWHRIKDNILPLKSQTLRDAVSCQTLRYRWSLAAWRSNGGHAGKPPSGRRLLQSRTRQAGMVTVSLLLRLRGCGYLRTGPQNFGDLAHGAEVFHHDSQGGWNGTKVRRRSALISAFTCQEHSKRQLGFLEESAQTSWTSWEGGGCPRLCP